VGLIMSERPTQQHVQQWAKELDRVGQTIALHFARSEPRARALGYLRGLLSDTQRKNSWQLAEFLGDATPDGVQHLLARADWDAEAVRDDLLLYVQEKLGTADGVLIVDETGFLKKGSQSCGVQRQYSGTAGRIENCQIGVFLAYATVKGHALFDRELYLPEEWANDPNRREKAKVPKGVSFATKPELAQRMLKRAWQQGVTAAWLTGDTVYGHDGKFRRFLEANRQPYVLAVPANQPLFDGQTRSTVKDITDGLPKKAWRRASAGEGTKGPRWYDWAVRPFGEVDERGWQLWLVVRRQCTSPQEQAYYFARGPADTPREVLIGVAGTRWRVEECLELAKGDCGLDEYEVRTWTGWYRHVTLSLWALAVVVGIRAKQAKTQARKKGPGS
jgi:SRSO17 transposase